MAGHRGLVGSAILETLQGRGYQNLVFRTRSELDLLDQKAVKHFYEQECLDIVFVAAAKVGGIAANARFRADFIRENLAIQDHLIWGAHEANVGRLIFLGSSCIYPRNAPQPMTESALLTSPLEYTNRPYAIAKIAGLELVESLRKQYGRDYFSVMPTNIYGPRDTYHSENAHVLPALIERFWRAKKEGQNSVAIWGTGKPLREFIYSLDCADAIVFLAETMSDKDLTKSPMGEAGWSHVNVGSGQEISIGDLGKLIARLIGYGGNITFDSTKPDGSPRKLLDSSFLHQMGWKAKTSLEDGIRQSIAWFETNATNS